MDCEDAYQLNIDAGLNLLELLGLQFSHYVCEGVTGFNFFVVRMLIASEAIWCVS